MKKKKMHVVYIEKHTYKAKQNNYDICPLKNKDKKSLMLLQEVEYFYNSSTPTSIHILLLVSTIIKSCTKQKVNTIK